MFSCTVSVFSLMRTRCIGWSKSAPFLPSSGKYTICSETAFWRTNSLNGASFDENLQFAMDLHFLGRLAQQHPTKYLNQYLGCLRCHDDSKSSTIWMSSGAPESENVYRDLFGCEKYTKTIPKTLFTSFSQFIEFCKLPIFYKYSYLANKLRLILTPLLRFSSI